MPPGPMLASSTPWPAVLVGVAVVVAVCLWLLFRPGSMADRARDDHPDDGGHPAGGARPVDGAQPAEGGD